MDMFSCEWCDECRMDATDEIMRMIGYTIALVHNRHDDDAEETWRAAWNWTLALPADYPDYAELCGVVSSVCPIPETQ